MNSFKFIATGIIFILHSVSVSAQGWPEDSGSYFLKFSQSWTVYGHSYNEVRDKVPLKRTRSFGVSSIYGEYGITDRLTVKAYLPLFVKSTIFARVNAFSGQQLQAGEKNSGFGDMVGAIQYAFNFKKTILSAALVLGLPTGSYDPVNNQLPTGDGEFNQQLNMGLARSFSLGIINPFSAVFIGYNNRTNGFSDEWHAGFKLGTEWQRFLFITEVYAIQSLFNGSFNDQLLNGGAVVGNNAEMQSINLQLAYKLKKQLYMNFQINSIFGGRYYFAGQLYEVGIFLKGGSHDGS